MIGLSIVCTARGPAIVVVNKILELEHLDYFLVQTVFITVNIYKLVLTKTFYRQRFRLELFNLELREFSNLSDFPSSPKVTLQQPVSVLWKCTAPVASR